MKEGSSTSSLEVVGVVAQWVIRRKVSLWVGLLVILEGGCRYVI